MKNEKEILLNVIGKHYDLEVISNRSDLYMFDMSLRTIKEIGIKKYKNVELMNINGLGIGQAHFITKDGYYLLLPWCYIISMIPSKEEMVKKD